MSNKGAFARRVLARQHDHWTCREVSIGEFRREEVGEGEVLFDGKKSLLQRLANVLTSAIKSAC